MPRQWQPIVGDFSRVMKLVHLAYRRDPMDVTAISSDIFRAKRQAYEDGLTAQAANVGCSGRRGMAGPEVLTDIKEESDREGAGIVNTYNYDLALATRTIRQATPRANRYTYAKRLNQWDKDRAEWKSRQIQMWNTMKWRDRAAQDFLANNPQLKAGWAILKPRNVAVCDVCRFWMKAGKVDMAAAAKVNWPAHLNCPHYWEMHYEAKGKADCDELWLGMALRERMRKEDGTRQITA